MTLELIPCSFEEVYRLGKVLRKLQMASDNDNEEDNDSEAVVAWFSVDKGLGM